jgi:hypothetical protein
LSAHTDPLQPEAILGSRAALPNLQTSKRKLVKYFCCNLLTLPYFKYTPVKAKIITNVCFGGAVNRNSFYFLILLFTSLHVSASTGHPPVKYIVVFNISPEDGL